MSAGLRRTVIARHVITATSMITATGMPSGQGQVRLSRPLTSSPARPGSPQESDGATAPQPSRPTTNRPPIDHHR